MSLSVVGMGLRTHGLPANIDGKSSNRWWRWCMKRMWWLGLVLAAGCGPKLDVYSVLPTGSEAMFVYDDSPDAEPQPAGRTGWFASNMTPMPYGTRVRIVNDPGPADTYVRDVAVFCLDGPAKDLTATIHRYQLRPLTGR